MVMHYLKYKIKVVSYFTKNERTLRMNLYRFGHKMGHGQITLVLIIVTSRTIFLSFIRVVINTI